VNVEECDVQVGGLRLHVREAGSGPPLVLVNGIGAHAEMWRPLETALHDVRLVSFDAPGTGQSATPLVPRTMGALARLVELLLDRLGLEHADVLGYSWGGALAQELALRSPARVRRLVLSATFPGWGGLPGAAEPLLAMMTPLRYWSRTYYEQTAGLIGGGRARTDRDHVARMWMERRAHAPSLLGYGQQLWALCSWSSLRRLERVEAPTLVITGDDDPLVPVANAFLMAARIPNARVVICPGEGHFQLLDADSDAVRAVRDFIHAERLEDAPVWRHAKAVDSAEAAERLRSQGLGAPPWGPMSALFRRLV